MLKRKCDNNVTLAEIFRKVIHSNQVYFFKSALFFSHFVYVLIAIRALFNGLCAICDFCLSLPLRVYVLNKYSMTFFYWRYDAASILADRFISIEMFR